MIRADLVRAWEQAFHQKDLVKIQELLPLMMSHGNTWFSELDMQYDHPQDQ